MYNLSKQLTQLKKKSWFSHQPYIRCYYIGEVVIMVASLGFAQLVKKSSLSRKIINYYHRSAATTTATTLLLLLLRTTTSSYHGEQSLRSNC